MTRSIDAATVTALAGDSIRMATLIHFAFPVPLRYTSWARNVTALSETWASSGHYLDISDVVETAELRVNSLTITLSGVEQSFISLLLNNNYHHIRALVYKAVIDSSDVVIGAPILIFDGPIESFSMDDSDDSSEVQITVASHWTNFEAINGRKTNSNSQQIHFPGDLGFEFSASTVKDIKWGKP